MKSFVHIVAALLLAVNFTACDALRSTTSSKSTSQGTPYEVVVICNQPEWDSPLGEALRSTLGALVPYLNQEETIFDVVRVTNQNYDGLIAKHRNVLEVNVQPSIAKPSVAVRYDVTAAPQIIMTLQAPTIASATAYVEEHGESIVKGFQIAERDRAVEFAQKYNVARINDAIFSLFGVEMKIPEGYNIRSESNDMLWVSKEHPIASQGVILYSYPAELGMNSLSEENLVEARNRFTAKIPGPSAGSYMTTYTEVPQLYRVIRIKGRLWVEMRGNWDVVNDFMGGPYVSYSTLDEETNKVFTIDCYVYSPKYGKRNYLYALEHLVYTAKFSE